MWFGKKQLQGATSYNGHRLNLWRCYNRCNPNTLADFIKCVEADATKLGHETFTLTEAETLILAVVYINYIENNSWEFAGPPPAKAPIPYLPPTYAPNRDTDLKTFLVRFPVSDQPLIEACMKKVIADYKGGVPIDYWLVCAMPNFFTSYTWGSEFDPSRLPIEPSSGSCIALRWY